MARGDKAVVVSPAKLTYPADEPADYCVSEEPVPGHAAGRSG